MNQKLKFINNSASNTSIKDPALTEQGVYRGQETEESKAEDTKESLNQELTQLIATI